MISDRDKQGAWRQLWFWLDDISQLRGLKPQQLEYLRARIAREAFPGAKKKVRKMGRDVQLVRAVRILKARRLVAGKRGSDAAIFRDVARHYKISESKVKQAYLKNRSWLNDSPVIKLADGTEIVIPPPKVEQVAAQQLPEISFDDFTE